MRKLILTGAVCAFLAGCASDGSLTPQGQVAVKVLCTIDAVGQPLASTGATIAAAVDPTIAPEVALAKGADQLAHPAVVQACQAVGGTPASVVVSTSAPK